ncbi:unnamed protein product [Victoria cruziana]
MRRESFLGGSVEVPSFSTNGEALEFPLQRPPSSTHTRAASTVPPYQSPLAGPLAQHAFRLKTPPAATCIRQPFFLLSLFICIYRRPSFVGGSSFSHAPHGVLSFR